MEPIKIENFCVAHPEASFPWFRHLSTDECKTLQSRLSRKLGIPNAPPLQLLTTLERLSAVVPNAVPSNQDFHLNSLPIWTSMPRTIYVNWYRLDDIDEMAFIDFCTDFHDLWYPSSDDIEIFDDTLSWV